MSDRHITRRRTTEVGKLNFSRVIGATFPKKNPDIIRGRLNTGYTKEPMSMKPASTSMPKTDLNEGPSSKNVFCSDKV